ncbi:MAG: hypothetical protein H6843_09135 [Rhodospirillaceae bacterium]|nr:hypothetical protein [Rhodospirillaceae bacterium]
MLDSLAYDIYALGPNVAAAATIGLLCLGGFLRACLHPPVLPLTRSRFFLLSCFLGVLASVSLLPPLLLPWAISSGMLFALLALQWALAVAIGAGLYPIAAGRALDAFDNPRWGALAYIPVCGIVLLVKGRARTRRSSSACAPQRTSAILNSSVGLFLALLVLMITVTAFRAYEGLEQAIASNPELRDQVARRFMTAFGVEDVVNRMAESRRQDLPHRLNEHLVVTDVVADGHRLVLTATLDPPDLRLARMIEFGLPHGRVRDVMVTQICAELGAPLLLEDGAIFVLVFTMEPDGELGRLEIAHADCAETLTPGNET